MKELMTIQMAPEEYDDYRNYKNTVKTINQVLVQKEEMIDSLRDLYHREFVKRTSLSVRLDTISDRAKEIIKTIADHSTTDPNDIAIMTSFIKGLISE